MRALRAGCSTVTPMPRTQKAVSAASDRPTAGDSVTCVPLERWSTVGRRCFKFKRVETNVESACFQCEFLKHKCNEPRSNVAFSVKLRRYSTERARDIYFEDFEASALIMSSFGGFRENIDLFDAALFGLPRVEAAVMDPQHRSLLEGMLHARASTSLATRGADPLDAPGCGVYIGISSTDCEAPPAAPSPRHPGASSTRLITYDPDTSQHPVSCTVPTGCSYGRANTVCGDRSTYEHLPTFNFPSLQRGSTGKRCHQQPPRIGHSPRHRA